MASVEGVHIDNDDIKDVFEDAEHLAHEVEEFMNPDSPLMQKAIELDANVRFSAPVQAFIKQLMADLEITDVKQLEKIVETIAMRVGQDMESCPYFRRMHKAVERFLRFAMKNVEITDLPTGKRMEWVNHLTKQLYDIMKSENNVEDLEEFLGEIVHDALREIEYHVEDMNRREQKFNKNGGI